MFIFKSKEQKRITKLYKELEKEYRQLDTLKEQLWNNRLNPESCDTIRADIESTNETIQEIKIEIIKLEK